MTVAIARAGRWNVYVPFQNGTMHMGLAVRGADFPVAIVELWCLIIFPPNLGAAATRPPTLTSKVTSGAFLNNGYFMLPYANHTY